jgi:hypothetical protein
MTDTERATLRLKCIEMFVLPASRNSLVQGEIFKLADQAYRFAIEELNQKAPSTTERPKKLKN